jgi:alkanesulfonate monooxygenase SsuD/methylene tetrahydromethanopterin reductase-like flavin-dependent oxidoreductase (luciferase family)
MRFWLKVNQHQLEWPELLYRVRLAEELRFDGALIFDHFKALDGDPSGPCMEAWTLLAALAASTDRIRLGALATGVMWRHPSVLAAEAITVDRISSGRLDVALGAGSFEPEHRELGVEFPEARDRVERLDEAIQVMRLLMTEDDVFFSGRHYRLESATYRPRPVQRPHPPIWVGAGGDRLTIPLAARRADVWHCFSEFEELPYKVRVFDEHVAAAGRDPASIQRATNLPPGGSAEMIHRGEALRELGFTQFVTSWPPEGRDDVARIADEVLSRLRGPG